MNVIGLLYDELFEDRDHRKHHIQLSCWWYLLSWIFVENEEKGIQKNVIIYGRDEKNVPVGPISCAVCRLTLLNMSPIIIISLQFYVIRKNKVTYTLYVSSFWWAIERKFRIIELVNHEFKKQKYKNTKKRIYVILQIFSQIKTIKDNNYRLSTLVYWQKP